MHTEKIYACFATTNRGLEEILAKELSDLGATDTKVTNAGIQFNADFITIMRCNLHSRLASRIMIQIIHGSYSSESDIYDLALEVNWSNWFDLENNIKVSTTAIRSPLSSLNFVTLKVKDAICDSFAKLFNSRPNVDKYQPDMRIYNFLTSDTVTIYLDTSGEGLFKRGYRQSKLEAPLKENLAAGLLKLANWQPHTPLYDPMCGSGTIIIEAISLGLNIAPGLNREFAFEKFNFMTKYQNEWQKQRSNAKSSINHNQKLTIFASDINQKALNITKDNFKNLGLANYAHFSCGDFLALSAPKLHTQSDNQKPQQTNEPSGMILTNPPYGIRLEELDDLAAFYPKLASHLKQNYPNWNCYFLTADLRLPKLMRLKPSRKTPVFNGALECRLFEFKMVKGSNRDN